MEVFICFSKHSNIHDLERTLEAWDCMKDTQPIGLEISGNPKRFEVMRRVAAESASTGDYILAELGFIPTYADIVAYAERLLSEQPTVGMFTMRSGVSICRKGIVDKWPEMKSSFYQREHAKAYLRKGYKVLPCPQVYCRRFNVS